MTEALSPEILRSLADSPRDAAQRPAAARPVHAKRQAAGPPPSRLGARLSLDLAMG